MNNELAYLFGEIEYIRDELCEIFKDNEFAVAKLNKITDLLGAFLYE
jgi:hypothetical protein